MNEIIVGFSHAKSPLAIGSTIIAKIENRPYSHCYIRIKDKETGLWMVYQASHGYVNSMTFYAFKTANIVIKEYRLTPDIETYTRTLTTCKMYLGLPYSKLQLILIGLKRLFNIKLNVVNNDKAFICSEFAARICECIGINISGNLDYEAPSDLDRVLRLNNIFCFNGEYNG